ncbi:ribonuclease H-like domain-containing protein [Tanacetum coccineum]
MAYTSSRSSSSSDNEVYDDSFCSKSCRKNTENLNNKVIKLNEELSDCETDLYNYKRGLSQVEARLVEFKNNEIKFCERIRVLERDLELRDNKIENLRNELEEAEGSETLEQTFNRLQAIVSHLKFMDVPIEQDDLNQKFLSMSMTCMVQRVQGQTHKIWLSFLQYKTPRTVHLMCAAASLSHDTVCTYIATQPNGSQIKYEDITQIDDDDDIEEMDIKWNLALLSMRADRFWKKTGKKITIQGSDVTLDWSYMADEDDHALVANEEEVPTEYALMIDDDDIEEMDIKWNLALLSMRADRFWKKTGKKITIQGSDVAGFDKSKDWSYMADEDDHALVANEEEVPTEYALMAKSSSSSDNEIDDDDIEEMDIKWNLALLSIRADRFWKKTGKKITIQGSDVAGFDKSKDWSYMADEDDHALVANEEEVPTEYALMAKSSSSSDNELNEELSDCETDLYNYKRGLSQVEARLVEFKNIDIKFCERIRVLERDVEWGQSKTGHEYSMNTLILEVFCTYIATQPNGSQIKYEDITQIDDDDIEEMDIKWNLALLSMRADRFWKKTGKKITIQGSDVAGFDKSKVECFNCHKMGHFARECRAPRSQDKGRRESYKKDPKVEEPTPKAMIAIDGIGWDWSYMADEDENHALVANEEEVPTEYALMAKSSSSSDNEVYDDSFCSKSCRKNTENLNNKIIKLNEELSDCETDLYNYKRGLSQVEARLVEFKIY